MTDFDEYLAAEAEAKSKRQSAAGGVILLAILLGIAAFLFLLYCASHALEGGL